MERLSNVFRSQTSVLENNPRRILVIRAGALGDTLLLLPLIKAIRQAFPRAYLEVMGYLDRLQLVVGEPYAHQISSIDRSGLEAFFLKDVKLPIELVRFFGSFDLILSYKQDPEGLWTENLRKTGAKSVYTFNPFPPQEACVHMVTYLVGTLATLGLKIEEEHSPTEIDEPVQIDEQVPDIYYPRVYPPSWAREKALDFWKESGLPLQEEYSVLMRYADNHPYPGREEVSLIRENRPVLAIHAGSGSLKKVWPPEKFAQVCRKASEQWQARILLISGPADREIVQKVLGLSADIQPLLVENKPLWILSAILERCQAYLGNDSGVTHLAAAVGIPVVALFGPTNPQIWRPLGKKVKVLQANRGAIDSSLLSSLSQNGYKGLEALEVETVLKALCSVL